MEFRPMSPEEIERTMQFLLSRQAQFAADFEKLSAKTDRIAEGTIGLVGIVGRIGDGLERLTDRVDRLTDPVDQLTEAQRHTDEQLRGTDTRLDALIRLFDRHLREDHIRRPS